jgi:hypothetical protein
MLQCIAYEVVNNTAVCCVNTVANGNEWACSNPMCESMDSKMMESDRAVLVALFNIIDDDDENIESDTDDLCAAMEVLPMIREINCEVDGTHIGDSMSEAASVIASRSCPAGALKNYAYPFQGQLNRYPCGCTLIDVISVSFGCLVGINM